MRPDVALLCNLYRMYGSKLWLEQYAKGLFNAFNNQSDPEKAGVLLEELNRLQK